MKTRIETVIGWGECKFLESASLGFEMKNSFSGVLTKGRSRCGGAKTWRVQGRFSHT